VGRSQDRRLVRKPESTDRVQYVRLLEDFLQAEPIRELNTTTEVEKQVTAITSAVLRAYKASCPETVVNEHDITPWWNDELESLKKSARRAFNRYMRRKDSESWEAYKASKRELKKTLRHSKRESWRNFCSSVEGISEVCRLQKMVSKDPVASLGLIRKADGTMTESVGESLGTLMGAHFPESFRSDNHWRSIHKIASREEKSEAEGIVTLNGVRSAIKAFQPFKSPGPDGIFPALLQWGCDLIAPYMVNIFRACLATGYVPKAWRESRVVFLPKPGKKDYTEAKSFRPVSLTSFMLKTMERVMADHLEATTLLTNPLSRCQHAYRAGKSTDTALHEIVRVVERELNVGGISLALFMDIDGAFDKISFTRLNTALVRREVNPLITRWVAFMLSQRAVNLQSGKHRLRGRVVRGCPQGGVLSPILWNITVDTLLQELDSRHIHTVGYADDIAVVVSGKFLSTIVDIMKVALKTVEDWCKEEELTVNASKSDAVLFTRKRGLIVEGLRLFGSEINVSRSVRYLGVILDSKLTWNEHVDTKVQKATRALFQCKRVCGRNWGVTPEAMYWIYTMMVRPILTYAAVVWWPKVNQETAKKKLEKVQRLACIGITGAFRTTPTKAIEALLGLLPLDLFIKKTAAAAALRMHRNATWHIYGDAVGHRKILELVHNEVKDTQMPSEAIKRTKVVERLHRTLIADGLLHDECESNDICLFTDGSLVDGWAGAGIFSAELDLAHSLHLGGYVSVYQAELLGVMHALDCLLERGVQGKKILIALDNQAVIKRLQQTEVTSGLVLECVFKLNECAQLNEVTLMWVRGHIGTEQNERADELAKLGSSQPFIGPEPRVALGTAAIDGLLAEWSYSLHRKRWRELDTCKCARLFLATPLKDIAKGLLALKRSSLSWLIAMVTGHGNFRLHLKKLKLVEEEDCRLCLEEQETAVHILCNCPALASTRMSVFGQRFLAEDKLDNLKFKDMLAFSQDLIMRTEAVSFRRRV